ncbi:hypothetical protein PE066_15910 [Ramlibacter tataouinensis]|uniref:hypothetical protein n=1 Tax=Ramlibacter tataouinensis TaxID=94132 RepID=UPI0022F3AF66|nr:hypothetical protein [Ramlibacter tataouinensis]WBY00936.1 hypothetical protein PE066_15910 [Ramlibacter tataouinensis]
MSIFASPLFLRRVLWADAASCLACGVAQLAAPQPLSGWFGLPPALLLSTGSFLVGYALLLAILAARTRLPRPLVALGAVGNVGWALGCGAVLAWLTPTAWGIAWVALQAATVLVLADLQWMGLRATRGRAGMAPA